MDYKNIWKKTLKNLKKDLPQHAFEAWIDTLDPVGSSDSIFILEAPNQFAYDWIINNYFDLIQTELQAVESSLSLKISIASQSSQNIKVTQIQEDEPTKQNSPGRRVNINPGSVFSSFIEGPNNIFAKNAAEKVSKNPGAVGFNPLIIYGGVGLGKTHLLHSIANSLLAGKSPKNVVLASSEKFTNDFISSIQQNKSLDFSKVYRNADVLLVDDIQFFQGKEQTQEQFFHTFNDLYNAGKQIVMTADRYPGEMVGLQDRLLSRFQSGLHADIQPPDFETRVAILSKKAKENNLKIESKMLEKIASYVRTNIRDLESCITKVYAHSTLSSGEINEALIDSIIRERVGDQNFQRVNIHDVIDGVCKIFAVSEEELIGKSRRQNIAEARQVVAYLCREVLDMPLNTIGIHLGGRDHTTIIHAHKKVEDLLKKDNKFKRKVDIIFNEISLN